MLKKLVATVAFAIVLGATVQAEAITINSASYTAAGCLTAPGNAGCTVQGATLTPGPAGATFTEQNHQGAQGLGINFINTGSTPGRDPEIQGDPVNGVGSLESVAISFANPQIVTEIRLAQFYNTAELGSPEPDEIALLFADLISASLLNSSTLGAVPIGFDPSATFTHLNVAAGLWAITNPFGSNGISTLTFRAGNTPSPPGCTPGTNCTDNSDYSIALVQTSDVPEPTTLGLIGIGLLGLGAMTRRRRKLGR